MMSFARPSLRGALRLSLAAGVAMAAVGAGCGKKKVDEKLQMPPSRYTDMGPKKDVPDYLKGTIYERVELANREPYPVSAYGLVGRLRGTGDTFAPTPVRSWMIKEMVKHGFGSRLIPGFENIQPEDALNSPAFSIVEVHASLPPGARKGDWIDVHVRCLPKNRTTSLSRGMLYETDLKVDAPTRTCRAARSRSWRRSRARS